jgi:hypothetical protein
MESKHFKLQHGLLSSLGDCIKTCMKNEPTESKSTLLWEEEKAILLYLLFYFPPFYKKSWIQECHSHLCSVKERRQEKSKDKSFP